MDDELTIGEKPDEMPDEELLYDLAAHEGVEDLDACSVRKHFEQVREVV